MFKLVVLTCLVAAASAQFGIYAPYASLPYSAAYFNPYNYRGPLSLAPGQPANILGADGRPLDTLDVNLDRSAHFTAKAFKEAGIHVLKKRSAPIIAAPIRPLAYTYSPLIARPYAYTYAAPYAYTAPISFSTPYIRTY